MLSLGHQINYLFAEDEFSDTFKIQGQNITYVKEDPFGIAEIYPTAEGGREWYVNMSNPENSSDFSETGGFGLIKQKDGSWTVNSTHVRLVVSSPSNQTLTGYIKLNLQEDANLTGTSKPNETSHSASNSESAEIDDLAFIGRSGRHNSEVPCEGTAYIGGLNRDGEVGWKKEIWHTGGYTEERAENRVTESILDRWIGWKVIMYDIPANNGTGVKLESYLDDMNNDTWTKITGIIDSGGWYTESPDREFFSEDCGRERDFIIDGAAPLVIFRSDNLILDFKNLSVREIVPYG